MIKSIGKVFPTRPMHGSMDISKRFSKRMDAEVSLKVDRLSPLLYQAINGRNKKVVFSFSRREEIVLII